MRAILLILLVAFASTHIITIQQDLSETITLAPNTPQTISNPLSTPLTYSCVISTSDADDVIDIDLTGTGSVNGVSESGNFTYTVKDGETLTIVSGAGSELSLTNTGASTVVANCEYSL